MQNNVFPTVFYMWNCANNYNTTLGHDMFFDIYKLSSRIGNGGSPCGRSLTAATDDTQPSYKQKRSGNNVLHFANLPPDHNFQFSIFNFQLKNFRLGIYALALKRLSSRTGKGGSPSI